MNKEEFDDLHENLFSSESNEGKKQKESALEKVYLEVINDEKKATMNWDFETFIQQTPGDQIEEVSVKNRFRINKIIYWAAASIVLLFAGNVYINYHQKLTTDSIETIKLTKESHEENVEIENKKQTIIPTEVTSNVAVKSNIKNTPSSHKKTYNPEYVEINGQPVDDEEEAIRLVIQTLGKFTSKVEKSVSTMENVKYLSIKI